MSKNDRTDDPAPKNLSAGDESAASFYCASILTGTACSFVPSLFESGMFLLGLPIILAMWGIYRSSTRTLRKIGICLVLPWLLAIAAVMLQ